jgi:predicted TIM-barrel fold metal-dependent hydrolase
VAQTFPDLPIVLGHGAYPYVNEAIGVAFQTSTVGSGGIFLSPDVYMFAAGGDLYVKGVEWMPERFLFATAYPFGSCEELVERTLNLPIDEKALAMYMYENAEDLLGL